MARPCIAPVVLLAAAVLARGSVTVSWNAHPAARTPARAAAPVRSAVVESVRGTRVLLRMPDGTLRRFIATPGQARALQALVGKRIEFRAP